MKLIREQNIEIGGIALIMRVWEEHRHIGYITTSVTYH